jgi:hypothetical protein
MKSYLTFHATGTPPGVELTRADIDREDRRRGFAEIGYHYVIRRDGTVETGRSLDSASVHDDLVTAKLSVSVILVGGADEHGAPVNNFTEKQMMAASRLHEDLHPSLGVVFVHPSLKRKE